MPSITEIPKSNQFSSVRRRFRLSQIECVRVRRNIQFVLCCVCIVIAIASCIVWFRVYVVQCWVCARKVCLSEKSIYTHLVSEVFVCGHWRRMGLQISKRIGCKLNGAKPSRMANVKFVLDLWIATWIAHSRPGILPSSELKKNRSKTFSLIRIIPINILHSSMSFGYKTVCAYSHHQITVCRTNSGMDIY